MKKKCQRDTHFRMVQAHKKLNRTVRKHRAIKDGWIGAREFCETLCLRSSWYSTQTQTHTGTHKPYRCQKQKKSRQTVLLFVSLLNLKIGDEMD